MSETAKKKRKVPVALIVILAVLVCLGGVVAGLLIYTSKHLDTVLVNTVGMSEEDAQTVNELYGNLSSEDKSEAVKILSSHTDLPSQLSGAKSVDEMAGIIEDSLTDEEVDRLLRLYEENKDYIDSLYPGASKVIEQLK